MGIKYINSFRKRYYDNELDYCRSLGVLPVPYDYLLKRSSELNKSNYSSELWFMSHLHLLKYDTPVLRNYPILNRYFADFYFPNLDLVVEIDGKSHDLRKVYDSKRDELFSKRGFKVIRIRTRDDATAKRLVKVLNTQLSLEKAPKKMVKMGIPRNKRPSQKKNKSGKNKLSDRQRRVMAVNHTSRAQARLFKEQQYNEMMLNALRK